MVVVGIYAWYFRDAYKANYNKFDENFSQQLLEHETCLVLKNNSSHTTR